MRRDASSVRGAFLTLSTSEHQRTELCARDNVSDALAEVSVCVPATRIALMQPRVLLAVLFVSGWNGLSARGEYFLGCKMPVW